MANLTILTIPPERARMKKGERVINFPLGLYFTESGPGTVTLEIHAGINDRFVASLSRSEMRQMAAFLNSYLDKTKSRRRRAVV